ncbi:Hypothetical repeat protein [Leishmania donovani]|uniref:Hypothetical repeat protein n=1 Tax=Leishmania donovani TaxID=5661 RepID=E9BDT3_LEIDO|nr:Hypothetical repeat protein [Leishmania donovani]CBZ33409.1 Hypothetical repeat protein [Leishmania donovani]
MSVYTAMHANTYTHTRIRVLLSPSQKPTQHNGSFGCCSTSVAPPSLPSLSFLCRIHLRQRTDKHHWRQLPLSPILALCVCVCVWAGVALLLLLYLLLYQYFVYGFFLFLFVASTTATTGTTTIIATDTATTTTATTGTTIIIATATAITSKDT